MTAISRSRIDHRYFEMPLGELVLSMDADFRRRERDNDWLDEPVWVIEGRRRAQEERARRAARK